jgi:Holliday junction resolvasome RuvABC endonuclease subunit
MKVVVGIDISLTGTGIAMQDGWCSVVGRTGILNLNLPDACRELDRLAHEIASHVPYGVGMVAMEMCAFSRATGGAVERHHLWYSVASQLVATGVPVAEVPATTLKKYATGKGSSNKAAMVDALARRMPQFVTRGNDNLVDAAWLCAMGADHIGQRLVELPAKHREALDAVTWPAWPQAVAP